MQTILKHLIQHRTLSRSTAREVLVKIAEGAYNQSQIAAFLGVYMMRPANVEELSGFRDALLGLCRPVDLSEFNTIDLCGTGGDGKNTFNVSTISSLVVAGAGIKVAKHGNYGVSSLCGSSNVMEFLGYEFTNEQDVLKKQLDKAGICFLHAPLFHPAMKAVGPIRRDLGMKTFFNILGPMVNPSFPQNQIVGVFDLETARLYNYIYQQTDKQYSIVHALDGYDEVSLTGGFKLINATGEYLMQPEDLGLSYVKASQIYGGETIEEAAKIFVDILEGKGTEAQNMVVEANAALAIKTVHPEKELNSCVEMARASIVDGRAMKVLKKICNR
ncbi:anthranilate phosphoribosyltransferase [Puteibacter caeruleilacunae]|nr:anthranilate phosphoribosyltransferase [Puteibacter caeruleilacunae]